LSQKRSVVIGDICNFGMVSDPQVSPDGRSVVFVLTRISREENEYRHNLYMAEAESGVTWQLTNGDVDESPRWSPDGSAVAFLSRRSGSKQLWTIPVSGGEARQVTSMSGDILQVKWAPDSETVALAADPAPTEGKDGVTNDARDGDMRSYTGVWYKANGEGYWDGACSQIFTVNVGGSELKQLTDSVYDDCDPAWSGDGRYLAYVRKRQTPTGHGDGADLRVIDLSDESETLVTASDGPLSGPSWSPNDERIAYYGHDGRYGSATLSRIWIARPFDDKDPTCVSSDLDRAFPDDNVMSDIVWGAPEYSPLWAPDGKSLLSLSTDRGATNVYRIWPGCNHTEKVTSGARAVRYLSASSDISRVSFVSSSLVSPGEIFLFDVEGDCEKKLTEINDELLASLRLCEPEHIEYAGDDGWEIDGWFMKPVDSDQVKKCPLILHVHGGPHSAHGYAFNHMFQLLAGKGYGVLYINPRGSSGYGQSFMRATHHDWGGSDYVDLMKGVDHVIDSGKVDEDRLAITGLSFGGYMTNWAISQSDRFRAAVSEVSTSNRYSQWGTSDYGHTNSEWEFAGYPWRNAEHYLQRSPITYVDEIETPVLLIQAEEDHRCPLEQAEQFFTALAVLGREVELVIVPRESHTYFRDGEPLHREERLERILQWFSHYLCDDC